MTWLRNTTLAILMLSLGISTVMIICLVLENITLRSHLLLRKPAPKLDQELQNTPMQLLDLPNFKFLINNDICLPERNGSMNTAIKAIIIVTSHAGDVEARSAIRRAYPQEELAKLGVKRVFLLAVVNKDSKNQKYNFISQNALLDENRRYLDIVQGNFVEAYRNLTYKHVMGLQWAVRYCSNASYIIKMDDDVVVDLYQLLDLLQLTAKAQELTLMGYVLRGVNPVREPTSKWYVTREEYQSSIYPAFLSGWLYVTTIKVASTLVKHSKEVPYFWIDDTFVTGILAHIEGIQHQDISQYFTLHSEYLECCLKYEKHPKYMCDYIIGPNGGNTNILLRIQKFAAKCHLIRCKRRPFNKMLNKTCVTRLRTSQLGKGQGEVKLIQLFK